MFILRIVFITTLLIFSTMAHAVERNLYSVGLASAYKYQVNSSEISIPIEFPLSVASNASVVNWSKKEYRNLPDQFVISNGSVLRSFLEINKSEGTVLKSQIKYINAEIRRKLDLQKTPISKEVILQYLADHIQEHLAWLTKEEQSSVFDWDHDLSESASLNDRLNSERIKLLNQPVGMQIATQAQHFAIPFERILKKKKGYCIDMALLASFVLESFEIPHRIVFGSILENDSLGLGHTWIELPDQRILDVAWGTLAAAEKEKHAYYKDWLWFGNDKGYQYRYEYSFFPILKK